MQNLVIAGTLIGVLVLWGLIGTLPLPLGVAGAIPPLVVGATLKL